MSRRQRCLSQVGHQFDLSELQVGPLHVLTFGVDVLLLLLTHALHAQKTQAKEWLN